VKPAGGESARPATTGAAPVVFVANDPWASQWRRKQQLASRLAARRRVYYLDPPFSPLDFARGTRSPGEWLRSPYRCRADASGVRVVRGAWGIPAERFSALVELANAVRQRAWARSCLDRLAREEGLEEAVLICYAPLLHPLAPPLRVRRLVYDAIDDYALLSRARRLGGRIDARMKALAAAADLTLVPDENLRARLRPFARRIVKLPHGVDTRAFRPDAWRGTRFADLRQSPGVKAVFHGTLNERLDQSLLLALLRAGVTLLLAGESTWPRRGVAELRAAGDLRLFGLLPQGDAGALVASADVGIIPYRPLPGVSSLDNLKAAEFLAAGLPVVASGDPQARASPRGGRGGIRDAPRGGITLAAGPEAFVRAVREAGAGGASPGKPPIESRDAVSWEARVRELEALLES